MNEEKRERRPVATGIGEVLFDCLPSGMRLGGAPANFAYIASRLGGKGAVASAVGKDDMGRLAGCLLAEKGLEAHLAETDRPTGHVDIALQAGGVPSYRFAPDPAYEAIPFTDRLQRLAEETDICCFGTLAQRGEMTRRTVRRFLAAMRPGSLRVFDVNLRDGFQEKELVCEMISLSDAVKCNEEELPLLSAFAGLSGVTPEGYWRFLKKAGVKYFIYTEGEKGSTVYGRGERSVLPSPPCGAADTVGAGDSFTAALMTGLYTGLPLPAAHRLAVKTAAFVCTQSGGMPDFPEDAPHWVEEMKRG